VSTRHPSNNIEKESRRGATLALGLPKREPVDEKIMPAFDRLERGRAPIRNSTFADRLDSGNNGIGDGRRD
jgi:hypothetical protein